VIGETPDEGDITFVTRGVTAAEIAAVTAVLTAALAEKAADRAVSSRGPSAWQRSQRPLRSPLTPGNGAWRSFAG
jgi:hypothetical protein